MTAHVMWRVMRAALLATCHWRLYGLEALAELMWPEGIPET